MLRQLCRFFYNANGWTYENQIGVFPKRAVLLAVPHTSNWDMAYGLICFEQMGIPVKFAIKKEWLNGPVGKLIADVGGLGIDRSGNLSTVDATVQLFEQHVELIICITPEGTRAKTTRWKTGFYHIAKKANVPILLGYFDYPNKKAYVAKSILPSDNMEADMKEIMTFYANHGVGKKANQFAVDERYV